MLKPATYSGVLVWVLTGALTQAQVAPPAPPTPDQIQKMIDAQAYRPALQAIAQILPSVAGTAAGGGKYALLMMRGECLLQLKDSATAIIAFDVGVHNQSELCIFDYGSGVIAQGAAGSSEGMGVPLKAAARAAPKKW